MKHYNRILQALLSAGHDVPAAIGHINAARKGAAPSPATLGAAWHSIIDAFNHDRCERALRQQGKRRTIVTATAPAHWACYLVNGDGGELDPDEADQVEEFADWLLGEKWRGGGISCDGEEFFAWRHSATRFGVGGATCLEYSALAWESV